MLVIAGPGTGKTEILAARIANILASCPDTRPENILCLTYTDAGTVAMRSRLIEFIGPDAYRVDISTFHSFCSGVISEQGEFFGADDLTPASDLERYQVVREIIDLLPQGHLLTRETGDIYYEASRLLELYSIMKQEAWTPAHLTDCVDEWIDEMKDSEDFIYKRAGRTKDGWSYKKGDFNDTKYEEAVRKAKQFGAAATTFTDYQRLMSERKRYDFADMILWVSQAFSTTPALLSHYQDKYLYVLVDEFQDTSGSQAELLKLLVSYSDTPNIFVVGDDDQSIYRFQGASVENIRDFQKRFSADLTTVTLTENHRSSQNILDAAGLLIDKNTERMSVDKTLSAVNIDVRALTDKTDKVDLRRYPTLAMETALVAKEIVGLKESGIELNKIAVIYRNHRQSEDLIRYLSSVDISVVTRKRADILTEPLIKKIIDVLRYLAAELKRPHSGEQYLFRLLHDPYFELQPLSLARFSAGVAKKTIVGPDRAHWREELVSCVFADVPADEVFKLNKAGQAIDELIAAAATTPLLELLHNIISKLGILSAALTGNDQVVWNLQLLNTLFDFVRDEAERGGLDLGKLLLTLDEMHKHDIPLPIEKMSDNGEGINFVTAHGAKGLEYDYVYMIGCTSKAWDAAPRARTYQLPPTVWRSVVGSEEEEARRLFYVGMTRAKRKLVICCPAKDNNDKPLEQSRFMAELVEAGCVLTDVAVDDKALVDVGAGVLVSSPIKPLALFDDCFVDGLLEHYSLSVSHLSAYLKCPTDFYFTRLLKAPQSTSIAQIFGLSVHYALEMAFKSMSAAMPRVFPDADVFMADFKKYMRRHEAEFAPTEFRRRMEYAEAILPLFYSQHVLGWNENSLAEVRIKDVTVGGVVIKGALDRVELLDEAGNINVVDDKTGNHIYAKKKLLPPNPAKVEKALAEGKKPDFEAIYGGDYWRQAVFYQVLAEADPAHDWTVNEVRFEFVEPDKGGKYPVDVVAIDCVGIQAVKEQIVSVGEKIRNKEFSEGCGSEECEWCQFVEQQRHVT